MAEALLVQLVTSVANREDALKLAHAAVEARVAACVQVLGPITSVYRWEGATQEAGEFLCLLKVPGEKLERLSEFVRDNHPYDTPEIASFDCAFVDDRYLAWASRETDV